MLEVRRRPRIFAFLLALAALLALSLNATARPDDDDDEKSDQSRQQIRAQYTKYEFRIPMRDGARLFTSVFVPKDASSTKLFPFLLDRTPYGIAPYGVDNYPRRLGPAPSC